MSTIQNTEPKDLGCANGWAKDSKEKQLYTECSKIRPRHQLLTYKIGNCYNRFICPICNITYTVDSSD